MNTIRTLLAAAILVGASAAAIAALAAVSAHASAAPLVVVEQGESFAVRHEDGLTGNIVGGGMVGAIGQGESQQIRYADAGFAHPGAGGRVLAAGSAGGRASGLPRPILR
jgi:hypothetical protein